MKELKKVKDIWDKFMFILTPRQKKSGVVILLMTLIGALVETLGVSIILPFVQAMVNPDELLENPWIKPLAEIFHVEEGSQIVILIGCLIALVYILKNIYLTVLSYCRVRYSTRVQRELSVLMMKSYMKRGYLFFSQINTSDLLRGITDDVTAVYHIMYNTFRVIA